MKNRAERITPEHEKHNGRIESAGFSQVCLAVSERYNIPARDVIKTFQEAYKTVMDRKKRGGKPCKIEDIKCDLVFRRLESPSKEDVMLVFGPRQLVFLDVIPFNRVNPEDGAKTPTALLRICPGSFGRFSDAFPESVQKKMNNKISAVSGRDKINGSDNAMENEHSSENGEEEKGPESD